MAILRQAYLAVASTSGEGCWGSAPPLWFGEGSLLVIGALPSAYLTTVFTDGVWPGGRGWGQGSSEVELPTGTGQEKGKNGIEGRVGEAGGL